MQATLREADDYRALGGSKTLYRQHFEDREIADLVFLVEMRWKDVLAEEEEEEEDDYVLIDPRVGVFPGLFGDKPTIRLSRYRACRQCQEALTYMVRGFMSEFPAEGEESGVDAPVHPATAVEAFDAMPPGEIECSVTVNFANGATSGRRKKFNMNEIIEGTFVATEDGDAFLHPTTHGSLFRWECASFRRRTQQVRSIGPPLSTSEDSLPTCGGQFDARIDDEDAR